MSLDTSGSTPAQKILVVDDDKDITEVISKMLESEGYRVVTVHSGEEALKAVQNQTIHLIIMDIMMPGMNGIEALERLQQDRTGKSIPVIMLTALGDKEHVLQGLRAGAVDYVRKPADLEELSARVGIHLTLQKWRQDALREYGDRIRKEMKERYRIY